MLRRMMLAAASGDPYWSSTESLLHFDGPDGSTIIVDEKGRAWAAVGHAQIDTGQSKFGDSSLLVDGLGDYLRASSSVDFNFGAGDFTIEAWIRPRDIAQPGNQAIVVRDQIGGTRGWLFFLADGTGGTVKGALGFAAWTGASTFGSVADTIALSNGVWYHIAAVRHGGTLLLFKNGSLISSDATIGTSIVGAPSEPCVVGALWGVANPLAGTYFNGHIDELRITKGVARYTASFPVPTAPFPKTELSATNKNTVSLLHFDGPNASTVFADERKKAWSATGHAKLDTAVAKFGTASLRLDGTGDFIDAFGGADFDFGTGDFTVEMFIRLATGSLDMLLFDKRFGAYGSSLALYDSSAGGQVLVTLYAADANRASTPPLALNTWYHIALSKSAGVTRLFLDGVQQGASYADSNSYNGQQIRLGHNYTAGSSSAAGFNGWIDELRITKGEGRYTANFTPPVAAFPNQ